MTKSPGQPPSKADGADRPGRRTEVVFEGELSVVGVAEVVQMGCISRQRFWVEIWADDERQGAIVLDGGDIAGCATMGYGGDEAFYLLARHRKGRFRVFAASDTDARSLPATRTSWQELVMEAARLEDESVRESHPPKPDDGAAEGERQRARARFASYKPDPMPDSGAVLIPFPGAADRPPSFSSEKAATPPPPRVSEPSAARPSAPFMPEAPTARSAALPPPPASPPSVDVISAPPPPVSSRPPVSTPPVSSSPAPSALTGFAGLMQQATAAYLRRDYGEALRLFEQCLALRPGDQQVLHNIERLKKRGK